MGYRGLVSMGIDMKNFFTVKLPSIDYLIENDRDLQQLLVAERSMMFSDFNTQIFNEFVDEWISLSDDSTIESQKRNR